MKRTTPKAARERSEAKRINVSASTARRHVAVAVARYGAFLVGGNGMNFTAAIAAAMQGSRRASSGKPVKLGKKS